MTEIKIRAARVEEFDEILPALAARAYQDRFFNEDSIRKCGEMILEREGLFYPDKNGKEFLEYSGSLSVPFSCLYPKSSGAGQSFESFRKYWDSRKNDHAFMVFVAEQNGEVIGFVKGYFNEVDCDKEFPECSFPAGKNKILSLGSLYVDPKYRKSGVGRQLVKKYVEVMLEKRPDCLGMVTDCYWRNNSQYFFGKLGAKSIGFCSIPDQYLDDNLERKTQNITCEVMFWDRESLAILGDYTFESEKKERSYSRKTLGYSAMTVANGKFASFVEILEQNGVTNRQGLMIRS